MLNAATGLTHPNGEFKNMFEIHLVLAPESCLFSNPILFLFYNPVAFTAHRCFSILWSCSKITEKPPSFCANS